MPIVPVFSSHAATVIRLTESSLVGAPVYDTNFPSGEKRQSSRPCWRSPVSVARFHQSAPPTDGLPWCSSPATHPSRRTYPLAAGRDLRIAHPLHRHQVGKGHWALGCPIHDGLTVMGGVRRQASPPSAPHPSPEPPPSRPTPTQSQPHASSSSRQSTSTRRSLPPLRSHPVPRKKIPQKPQQIRMSTPSTPKNPPNRHSINHLPEK